jgi:hypothetical protein
MKESIKKEMSKGFFDLEAKITKHQDQYQAAMSTV